MSCNISFPKRTLLNRKCFGEKILGIHSSSWKTVRTSRSKVLFSQEKGACKEKPKDSGIFEQIRKQVILSVVSFPFKCVLNKIIKVKYLVSRIRKR